MQHNTIQKMHLVATNVLKNYLRGKAYILKGGICGHRIPQTIWNFRRKIVWERKKYQDYTVCRANWRSFPLLMFSNCNKLSIKTLKHTIFSMKIPHWHQILVIFMIYALLSRNFDVRIYALFPQIFGNWKVDSADFFTFRMYEEASQFLQPWSQIHIYTNTQINKKQIHKYKYKSRHKYLVT